MRGKKIRKKKWVPTDAVSPYPMAGARQLGSELGLLILNSASVSLCVSRDPRALSREYSVKWPGCLRLVLSRWVMDGLMEGWTEREKEG
uniref:Uncharacterized protein n=1 Tax=Caenorhabditis japonica TaxID=281687 RepID=A0A8R1E9L2_CAEJA